MIKIMVENNKNLDIWFSCFLSEWAVNITVNYIHVTHYSISHVHWKKKKKAL